MQCHLSWTLQQGSAGAQLTATSHPCTGHDPENGIRSLSQATPCITHNQKIPHGALHAIQAF